MVQPLAEAAASAGIHTPLSARQLRDLDDRVLDCALKAVAQVGAAFLINSTVLTFGVAPAAVIYGCIPLMGLLVNATYRLAQYLAVTEGYMRTEAKNPLDAAFMDDCRYFSTLAVVNWIGCAQLNVFLHEIGHAAVMKSLWKNVSPIITVETFGDGRCSGMLVESTALGNLIGPVGSQMLLYGGGPLASVLIALAEFTLSVLLKDKHSQLAELLEMHGISQLMGDILYGISSLDPKANPESDFVRMHQIGGLHPLVAVFAMIGVPLLVHSMLRIWRYSKENVNLPAEPRSQGWWPNTPTSLLRE